MKLKRIAGLCAVALCCLAANGCISIEQEIFLNADGSGDMVIFLSLPDLPEKMGPADVTKKNPAQTLADLKKELTTALPPTISLKEAKEIKQNGVQSIYTIFHFKSLADAQRVLANFGKGSVKEGGIGSDAQWSIDIQKKETKTFYTQRFLMDVDAKAKAEVKVGRTKQSSTEESNASNEMEEQLKPLILSIIRMRFVLHAPAPITDSNADIVMNERTAVWNCSLAAFAKDKKAIEMKATF